MAWMAFFLTLLTIFNVAALYLWLCQRSLEASLATDREVTLFPNLSNRRGLGAPIPVDARDIGGRRVGMTPSAVSAAPVAAPRPAALVADAAMPAVSSAPKAVAAKSGKAKAAGKSASAGSKSAPKGGFVDDVSLIGGVGPVLQKKLAAAGITSLKQIAKMTPKKMAALDAELGLRGRTEREEWIEQAQELVAGKPPRAKVDQKAAKS